jgi:ribonuclease J
MEWLMKRLGEPEFVEYLEKHNAKMEAEALAPDPKRWVIMARRGSLLEDYAAKGVIPNERDVWVWSMWHDYLKQESAQQIKDFFAPCLPEKCIHSSGHASPKVLQRFAAAMRPKMLIPVHGENWQDHAGVFSNIVRIGNGQWITLQ